MKRPCSPSQPRTPKRIKLAHPTDSPSNPFSPPKPISSTSALPPVTSLRHHLPLRFQIKGTRTFRVASVPRNYTFVHLQAVIEWLFRDVTDAVPQRRFSKRIFGTSQAEKGKAVEKPKPAAAMSSKANKSPVPRKIKLAATAGDDGPKFKVLVEVEKYESKFKSTFLEGVITSGRKVAQLSTRHDPFRRLLARAPSPSAGSSQETLLVDSDEEEADVECGSWVWEHPEEFTVGNAWPDGLNEKQGIVFHQHRYQEVHITVNTLPVRRLVGKRHDPYVFIAKGEGKLEYPDRDPDFHIDLDDDDRFGFGYGGSNEPDPQELELTYWNKAERGHRQCKGWMSFDEFFASHRTRDAAPSMPSLKNARQPASPVSPQRREIRPLPRKKLIFPNLREHAIASPSTPARRALEDDIASCPPTSSPCSEPSLTFSSSPVAEGSSGPTTPESPDEQSALHYWLGLGVEAEDLQVSKKPVSAALAVRAVLDEGLLTDDEDSTTVLPPMPSTPRRLRPCMSEPGSPLSQRSSPRRPRTLHHTVSLPRMNINDPTPLPASKLVRQRIDHWAKRRLARLTKKGLDDGVFKKFESGNEVECFPCRDDRGEVDELDTDEDELEARNRSASKLKGKSKPRRSSPKSSRPVHRTVDSDEEYYSDHYFSCGAQRMREESVEL